MFYIKRTKAHDQAFCKQGSGLFSISIKDLDQDSGDFPQNACSLIEISPRNIESIAESLYKLRVSAYVDFLKQNPQLAGLDFSIDSTDFRLLEKRWLDISPFSVLFSRLSDFAGYDSSRQLLEQLEAELKGSFRTSKFDIYREQDLGFLSEEAFAAWRKDYALAMPAGVDSAYLEGLASFYLIRAEVTQELSHSHKSWEESQVVELQFSGTAIEESILEWLGNSFRSQNPESAAGELIAKFAISNERLLLEFLLSLDMESLSFEQFDGLLKYLLSADKRGVINESGVKELNVDFLAKKTGQLGALMPKLRQPLADEIIISVINSDARFLLTIADFVDGCSSALNYKNGYQVYKLLSYVIDGMTKGHGVIEAKIQDFYSLQDFNFVAFALHSDPDAVQVDFDGNMAVTTFKIGAREVKTRPTPHGTKSRVVRIGVDEDGVAGIYLESVHSQDSRYAPEVDIMSRNIIAKMQQNVGALSNGSITVSPTRNLDGIYTNTGSIFTNAEGREGLTAIGVGPYFSD